MKTKKRVPNRDADLPDSSDDKKHMQPEEGILDLPDTEDIPGQEHIRVPKMNEFADTTISSDDEEGKNVFNEDNVDTRDSNVTKQEKQDLRKSSETTGELKDDENLADARVDDTDEDGELLNEKVNVSGSDLDVPGSEEDDADEEIGEEDEENNSYSLDGEDEDDSASKQ